MNELKNINIKSDNTVSSTFSKKYQTTVQQKLMLNERESNYGNFVLGAVIMQSLKQTMRDSPNWAKLEPYQKEALEMIQHKIGRILNGDITYRDSWEDIKGYGSFL